MLYTVTIICCYNSTKELESMLLPSFNNCGYNNKNLILINTKEEGFKSAAEAYNKTIEQRKHEIGDIIVFCHQDIAFSNGEFINTLVEEFKNNPKQIIGFAGITSSGTVLSNLKYRKGDKYITRHRVKEKTPVCSVDECCFAITKNNFLMIKFDEKTCNNWHLYAVDLCYNALSHDISSYVIPDIIYHKEDETLGQKTDNNFIYCMWHLINKYRDRFPRIYAPCYICSTNPLIGGFKLLKTYIKNIIKR